MRKLTKILSIGFISTFILPLTSCSLFPIKFGVKSEIDFSNLEPEAVEENKISFEEMNTIKEGWKLLSLDEGLTTIKFSNYTVATSSWIQIMLPIEQQISFIDSAYKYSITTKYPEIVKNAVNGDIGNIQFNDFSAIFGFLNSFKQVSEGNISLDMASNRKFTLNDIPEELWPKPEDYTITVEIGGKNYEYSFPSKEELLNSTNLKPDEPIPETIIVTFTTFPDGTPIPENINNGKVDVEFTDLPVELTQNYDFYRLNFNNIDFLINGTELENYNGQEIPNYNDLIKTEILSSIYDPSKNIFGNINIKLTINSLTYENSIFLEENTYYKLADGTYKIELDKDKGYYHLNDKGLFISYKNILSNENNKYVTTESYGLCEYGIEL